MLAAEAPPIPTNGSSVKTTAFADFVEAEVDALKAKLLQRYADEVRKLQNEHPFVKIDAHTTGNGVHASGGVHAENELRKSAGISEGGITGSCCSPRSYSRNFTISLAKPMPSRSWHKEVPSPLEASETHEFESVAMDSEVCCERSPPEEEEPCDDPPTAMELRWLELAADYCHLIEEFPHLRYAFLDDYLQIRGPWTSGQFESKGVTRTIQQCRNRDSHRNQLRMDSVILDEDGCCLQALVFHPGNAFRIAWSILGMAFLMWDIIAIPLLTFDITPDALEIIVSTAGRFIFAYWVADLVLTFFTGIETDTGIEMRPWSLCVAYMKSAFWLDITLVLIDVAIMVLESVAKAEQLKSMRLLRVVRFVRFLKLLRLGKVKIVLESLARRFTSMYFWLCLRVVSGMMFMLVSNHYLAIIFIAVGLYGFEVSELNWIEIHRIEADDFGGLYVASMHWALTQFMPATNKVGPVNTLERLYALFVVVVALVSFSTLVGTITGAVNAIRATMQSRTAAEAELRQFFTERGLSADLFTKIRELYKVRRVALQRVKEENVRVFQEVPDQLRVRLHQEMYMSTIASLSWLHEFQASDFEFLRVVCHFAVKELTAVPVLDIFIPQQECKGMIISTCGSLMYTPREFIADVYAVTKERTERMVAMASIKRQSEMHKKASKTSTASKFSLFKQDHATGTARLKPGTCLSEVALWAEWKYRGHLTTDTTCHYMFVDAAIFANLCLDYGGRLHKHLQIFGLLVVAHAEDTMVSDMPIDKQVMADLNTRAKSFENMQASSLMRELSLA